MTPYTLTFRLRGVPPRLNVTLRMHWAKRGVIFKQWYYSVALAVMGRKPPEPLKRATLHFTRFSSRHLDFDGLVGSLKPIADGLTRAGIISDDNWDVTGPWVIDQIKTKRGEESILITVIAR